MKQLTVRGFDEELERRLRRLAREEGVSMNQAALKLMRAGAGLGTRGSRGDVIGDALDTFFGTWTEDQEREVMEAVSDFERVDPDLWR